VQCENNCRLGSNGELINFEQYLEGEVEYPNRDGDGIGQVRGYFYILMYYGYLHENAFAILTNGECWVVFNFRRPQNIDNRDEILEIARSGLLNEDERNCYRLPQDFEVLRERIRSLLGFEN